VGVLYRQIRSWAQKNNWYKAHIVSHELWLKRNFGKEIRKKAVALEAAGAAALAGRIEREFCELLDVAGVFDQLCKRGCTSEKEFAEFERVKQQVRSDAFKLAQVLQTADKKPVRSQKSSRKIVDVPPASDDGQWVTFGETAKLLGISKSTVSKWADKGRFADNGIKGQKRRLSMASVLLVKQEIEDTDRKKDDDKWHDEFRRIR